MSEMKWGVYSIESKDLKELYDEDHRLVDLLLRSHWGLYI